MSENLKNNGVQQYLQEYEKLVNKGVRRNFSKETADTMFDLKDAEHIALKKEIKILTDDIKKTKLKVSFLKEYNLILNKEIENLKKHLS